MIGPQDNIVSDESLEILDETENLDNIPDRFSPESFSSQEVETNDELMSNSPLIDELSDTFVGNWNTLVSQTNWEKGAVIHRWREALIAAELPKTVYSDDAWARRVGNVTGQHVGRLRRVYERFGEKATGYPGLFWSHFQAALDWDDAEMWLEGAVQNRWSVAQMRIQRWEAVGAPEELKPQESDIFTAEIDEDVNPRDDAFSARKSQPAEQVHAKTTEIGPGDLVEGFDSSTPPFVVAEEDTPKKKPKKESKNGSASDVPSGPSTGELLATLKDFSSVPSDLADSFGSLKIAILNHKLAGWKDISAQQLLQRLDAFKALVLSVEE